MYSFLIILHNDITQTGILIFSLYTKLSSVLNLILIKLQLKINSSSSNSSIKQNISFSTCLKIIALFLSLTQKNKWV